MVGVVLGVNPKLRSLVSVVICLDVLLLASCSSMVPWGSAVPYCGRSDLERCISQEEGVIHGVHIDLPMGSEFLFRAGFLTLPKGLLLEYRFARRDFHLTIGQWNDDIPCQVNGPADISVVTPSGRSVCYADTTAGVSAEIVENGLRYVVGTARDDLSTLGPSPTRTWLFQIVDSLH